MPLLKEWNIGNHGRGVIWKIEEPEAFFREQVSVETDISNERRRTEHLAGRFLLKFLDAEFPLHQIVKDEHDKPRLPDEFYFFSISHSWPYVAAVIDPIEEAGIDIQTYHPNIGNIQHKYLSAEEQLLFDNDPKLLTLAWSAKEAVYKWNGKRGVDFIGHLPIDVFDNNTPKKNIIIYFKSKKMPKMVLVENVITDEFTCTYVSHAQDWAIY